MSYQQMILDLQKYDSVPTLQAEALFDNVSVTWAIIGVDFRGRILIVGTATPEMISRALLRSLDSESGTVEMPSLRPETAVLEEVVELVSVPRENAITLIKSYIDSHQGCRTGDIIYDLGLNPDLVLGVLRELEERGDIRGEDIE